MDEIKSYKNRKMSDDQWQIVSAIKDNSEIEGFTKFWRKRCCLPANWHFENSELLNILVSHVALDLFERIDWVHYFDFCKKYDNTKAMIVAIQLMKMRDKEGS